MDLFIRINFIYSVTLYTQDRGLSEQIKLIKTRTHTSIRNQIEFFKKLNSSNKSVHCTLIVYTISLILFGFDYY